MQTVHPDQAIFLDFPVAISANIKRKKEKKKITAFTFKHEREGERFKVERERLVLFYVERELFCFLTMC